MGVKRLGECNLRWGRGLGGRGEVEVEGKLGKEDRNRLRGIVGKERV
jgi:hypothetical protein